MSRRNRTYSLQKDNHFIKTMHSGFNYFHDIDFQSDGKRKRFRNRMLTTSVEGDDHQTLQLLLVSNKEKFGRIKTELHELRQIQLNDYVRKSLKYQEILNINDNKKKRLPTLNTKIGEVIKKSVKEAAPKNIEYSMLTTTYRLEGWKPQSRQGHTTTIFKNTAIIIGGHCSFPFGIGQVYCFDTQSWTKQFPLSSARSYHSAILYKSRYIIVFGGMGTYNISRKCRVCYNTINLIDLHTYTCRSLKMTNEDSIEGRRSHGCSLMGKYMLIFGGMNTKREFMKDFFYLDLKELKWYQKQYKIEGKQLNDELQYGLAKHKMIAHFKSTHKNLPLYSSQYSDTEGLYMFGGHFGNGYQNIVLFIGFNNYNPYIKKLEYAGIPPSSIEPIVQKLNENIIVIISGELNERCIKLFRLKEHEFVGVYNYLSTPIFGGLGSTLSNYNDQMYLFFGMGDTGYIGTVSSFKIDEKIIENEQKKKKQRNFDMDWKEQKDILSDSEESK